MRELPRGLIVSCQALEGNPLRDSGILAHLAKAAEILAEKRKEMRK